MPLNTQRPNTGRPNTSGGGVEPTPTPTSVTAPRVWRLEHRDQNGVRLQIRCDAFAVRVKATVNEPWTMTCEFPYTSALWALCAFPNQLWLYDQTDTLKQRFFIKERTRSIKDGIRSVRINAVSMLGLLAYDTIETSADYTTVAGALGAVISAQQNTPAISLGDVTLAYAAGAMAINLQNTTALAALYRVYEQSAIGGVFWVDPLTLELEWERDAGPYAGNIAATAINVAEIEISEDYGQLATRVVAQGKGIEADTRLVDEAEDAAAQALYGIRSTIICNRDISVAGTLTAFADTQLSMLNVPKQSISISAVDLSKVSASYMRSEIAVGQWLRIVDTVFGVEFRAMVHAVEFDPTRPADIKVEIGNALVGRTEWADPDGNKAAPGTPNRDSNKAESKDVLDYIADALERGLDADRIDPGFDHSLRESMYDPPAFDAVPFADLGILADSDFTDPTGDFNPENPDSIFSPENADGPLSPFNHDSYMSPDNPLSPLSPQYPGGALNPSTPGSPLGSVYGKFKPFLTA